MTWEELKSYMWANQSRPYCRLSEITGIPVAKLNAAFDAAFAEHLPENIEKYYAKYPYGERLKRKGVHPSVQKEAIRSSATLCRLR